MGPEQPAAEEYPLPQPHSAPTTTNASRVSIIIVSVTAMPYADARALDERKPTTSAITAPSSIQLMLGT